MITCTETTEYRTKRRAGAGFSLIELLASILIIGVVSSLGVTTFNGMMTRWNETRSLASLDTSAETLLDRIGDDIAAAVSSQMQSKGISGTRRDTQHKSHFDRVLADDTVSIAMVNASVTYEVRRESGRHHLQRIETEANTDAAPVYVNLDDTVDIIRFRVEYDSGRSGNPWQGGWHKNRLPKALRVSMTLADPDRPTLQISRKAVFPIHVN